VVVSADPVTAIYPLLPAGIEDMLDVCVPRTPIGPPHAPVASKLLPASKPATNHIEEARSTPALRTAVRIRCRPAGEVSSVGTDGSPSTDGPHEYLMQTDGGGESPYEHAAPWETVSSFSQTRS